ncbi:DUF3099 domain-containing protein [Neomicrococcus aestuarii]|uniref:DUF3099 domain-containing protein n=2 Tax=Neomicrococcus aestuarii TaxID=556325 RepID=A0A1L2ZLT8_9MICC|nr:DUF3099 domain-containing protein [Neomicrococcus aestuarii]APF40170.1 hypothetical protein BHE16_03045 [Neomicrococcus aestuarii]
MNRILRARRARSADQEPAFLITDARPGASIDEHSRIVKYSVSMGVRVLCFILAFFVQGWLQILCLVAAVVLPYFAVIIANGRPSVMPEGRTAQFMDDIPSQDDDAARDILEGELIGSPDSGDEQQAKESNAKERYAA